MENNSLLWKISKRDKKNSYLFGTVHLLPKTHFFIPEKVKIALLQSQNLWLEIDVTNIQEQNASQEMMQSNISLQSAINADEYHFLSECFRNELKQELSNYQLMQPIFILYLYMQHKMQGKIISFEHQLCKIASNNTIQINGLSSAKEQYSFGIEAVSYQDLVHAFVTMQDWNFDEVFQKLIQSYQTENLIAITHWIEKYNFENEKIHSILLKKRNQIWTEKITEITNENSHFFAVGAAHLLGNNGMITLLREKGFSVEAVF